MRQWTGGRLSKQQTEGRLCFSRQREDVRQTEGDFETADRGRLCFSRQRGAVRQTEGDFETADRGRL